MLSLRFTTTLLALAPVTLITACAGMSSPGMKGFDQSGLPAAVMVPAGHRVAMETIGAGDITYECRAKANVANTFEWVFVGPQADLSGRAGNKLGSYYGPPATWASTDGSKITGTQLATAPGGSGNIPLQLVKANPASSAGAMQGITYIQRVATRGGVAPAVTCDGSSIGNKQTVKYQADYIFWKAA